MELARGIPSSARQNLWRTPFLCRHWGLRGCFRAGVVDLGQPLLELSLQGGVLPSRFQRNPVAV